MKPRTHVPRWPALAAVAFLLPACMSGPQIQPGSAPVTPAAQAVSAPAAQSGGSALSYGTVTSAVVKGKTTQMDLIQWFGGPNISTVDADGVETWVYERSVSQTDVASKSQNWQAAANLGVSFGQGQGSASAGGGQSGSASSTASSFRSLTVIVKFNADKTVKDYSVRSSQF
jgi:hypothetical protein